MPRVPRRPEVVVEFSELPVEPDAGEVSCSSCRFFGGGHCHVDPPQVVRVAPGRERFERPAVDAEDRACSRYADGATRDHDSLVREWQRKFDGHQVYPMGAGL